jgi:hypothetical protein
MKIKLVKKKIFYVIFNISVINLDFFMGHFGLDISNLSIKVLEARNEANGFEILSFGK